jgi:hypothetical protein
MAITRPSTIHYPFAEAALPANINTIPDTPTGGIGASWQQGFPPITMTPLASGGSPPYGADFNGVLNLLSANAQWQNAGGAPRYDATLASAIGGYPQGAVLQMNIYGVTVLNTIPGNMNDPNIAVGPSYGWLPIGGVYAGASNYIADSGTANAYAAALSVPLPFYVAGMPVSFIAQHTNTGPSTLSVGGLSSAALVNNAGAPLGPGAIVAGMIYEARYDLASSKWWLTSPTIDLYTPNIAVHAQNGGTPITNASSSTKMSGLALYFTPRRTGNVIIQSSVIYATNGSPAPGVSFPYYGTGVAPATGAAATGSVIGLIGMGSNVGFSTGQIPSSSSVVDTLSLVVGTPYWFDISSLNTSAGTYSIVPGLVVQEY